MTSPTGRLEAVQICRPSLEAFGVDGIPSRSSGDRPWGGRINAWSSRWPVGVGGRRARTRRPRGGFPASGCRCSDSFPGLWIDPMLMGLWLPPSRRKSILRGLRSDASLSTPPGPLCSLQRALPGSSLATPGRAGCWMGRTLGQGWGLSSILTWERPCDPEASGRRGPCGH